MLTRKKVRQMQGGSAGERITSLHTNKRTNGPAGDGLLKSSEKLGGQLVDPYTARNKVSALSRLCSGPIFGADYVTVDKSEDTLH